MAEVHRYKVLKMKSEDGGVLTYTLEGPEIVMASAYDALLAENAELRAKASQGGEAVAELSSDEILMAFEENGFRIEPGASFSAKGQIAQLLNAVGAILSAHPADQVAEPVLERPAKVGAGIFSAGLPQRMVVEAAYRQYEYAQDPPFSDEQISALTKTFCANNP